MLGRSESEGIEPRNNHLQRADLVLIGEGNIALSARARIARPAGVLDRDRALHGTSRNLGDPVYSSNEVGADNVKSGGSNDDALGVGLAHSRGVAGVMPGD